jgi:hypothetical protein
MRLSATVPINRARADANKPEPITHDEPQHLLRRGSECHPNAHAPLCDGRLAKSCGGKNHQELRCRRIGNVVCSLRSAMAKEPPTAPGDVASISFVSSGEAGGRRLGPRD